MKTLGELRAEKDLTQKGLAEELKKQTEFEWAHSTIAMYETGDRTPPLEKAKAIARFFKVPVESIIFGKRTHVARVKMPKSRAV